MRFKTLPVAALLATLSLASTALAGPPLLCHTLDIGDAKSLPWTSQGWNLSPADSSYNTKNLAGDALSILNTDPTVIVHMETLRRATLFAQNDPAAAKQLLLKLIARSDAAHSNSSAGALASFDVGYFAATLSQLHFIKKDFPNPATGIDSFARVNNALQVRPGDGQMEFAAALILLDGSDTRHQTYAQKAIADAKADALLTRNLNRHYFGPDSETVADTLTRSASTKLARQ